MSKIFIPWQQRGVEKEIFRKGEEKSQLKKTIKIESKVSSLR